MDVRNIKIILPSKASELERYAANELGFFINKITGEHIGLASEYEPLALAYDCFISVGETKRFNEICSVKALKSRVGEDGFKIVMNKTQAYICGGAGQGTLFGVYAFLKKLFNLEFFTGDEYSFDKKQLELCDFESEEKPDIPMRSIGIGAVHLEKRVPGVGDKKYCYRMNLRQMDEGWGINNHTYFRILPPSTYYEKHPDWYDKNVKTLCYSNQEMIEEYVKNMKTIIEHTPNDSLYMIGMEDNVFLCDCPKCVKLLEKYKGNKTAVMLHFTNQVVAKLNAWLKETYPQREVYFFAFAYYWAELAPVERDVDGKFKLAFEALRPADNFGVLIANIHSNANYTLDDPRNIAALDTTYHSGRRVPAREIYEGWSAVVKNIATWNYNLNFYDFFCPCPMWNFLENSTFKFLKSVGTRHAFLEAGCFCEYANFARMKIYCASKLMWDNSLDLHTLIKGFMAFYYAGAEKEIYDYFVYLHKHGEWLNKAIDRQMVFVHFDDEPNIRLMDKRFYPKDMLVKSLEFFENALAKDITEQVKYRILLESLPAKYTLLYLYREEFDKAYVKELICEIRDISIKTGVTEAQDFEPKMMQEQLDIWEKELN